MLVRIYKSRFDKAATLQVEPSIDDNELIDISLGPVELAALIAQAAEALKVMLTTTR